MRFLITILRKVYCWVWVNFFKSVNIWQLQARTWLFRALRAPGQHAATPDFRKKSLTNHSIVRTSVRWRTNINYTSTVKQKISEGDRVAIVATGRQEKWTLIYLKNVYIFIVIRTMTNVKVSYHRLTMHATRSSQNLVNCCTKVAFEKVYNNHSHGLRLWTNW